MKNNTWRIVDIDGFLYVQSPWEVEWDRPVRYRDVFPTGVKTKSYPNLPEETVISMDNGRFMVVSTRLTFALKDGGGTKTVPSLTEEEAVPKPRGKKVWRSGEWVRG